MPAGLIVAFVIVFVLILLAVSAGLKYYDARRKQQVAGMLKTAAGEHVATISNLLKEVDADRAPGFRRTLSGFQFTKHAQELLQQAGMSWSPTGMISAMGLATIPGLAIGALFPILLNWFVTGLALAAVFASLPYLWVKHKRTQRLNKLEEQFPDSLDFLSRSMRAGHAFSISLEMLGEEMADPLGQEFRALFNEQNLGATLQLALHNFTERVPLLDVRFFTSSVLLQKQTGGNLSEILSRLAYVIRERFRLKGQVKAASAHGRMTAAILTILPIATMGCMLLIAPGYIEGMARDPDGKKMIGVAIFAQLLGNYFIKRIINIKV